MSDDFMVMVEVEINEKVETAIHVSDLIYAVNHLPLLQRWNTVAKLLNAIDTDEISELLPDQKQLIEDYFKKQTERFAVTA